MSNAVCLFPLTRNSVELLSTPSHQTFMPTFILTHTHTVTHLNTHTHTVTHLYTHMNADTHTHAHMHTHFISHITLTHFYRHTLIQTHTHARTQLKQSSWNTRQKAGSKHQSDRCSYCSLIFRPLSQPVLADFYFKTFPPSSTQPLTTVMMICK